MATKNRSLARVLCAAVACLLLVPAGAAMSAQTTATWTGGAGTNSYNTPGNWDIGVVPVNTATDDYIVVIGTGVTVDYDVPDGTGGNNQVTQLSLAAGSTLSLQGRNLVVQDSAGIAGKVTATSGSLTAAHVASTLSGDRAVLEANTSANPSDSASITVNASGTYTTTNSAVANTTILSANGANAVIRLPYLSTINSYVDHWGTNTRTISATSGGTIDLSGMTLLRGGSGTSGGTDSVRVVVTGGGTVDLSNLQQVDGYVTFATDASIFSLPSLMQAGSVSYELPDNATLNLPELLSQNGGGFAVTSGTTVNAGKLQTLANASVSFSGAGVFSASQLTDFSGSVLTLTDVTQTVTTGGLDQVDNARFLLSNGTSFNQIGDSEYVMTSSSIASTTVLSATGAGTTLDARAVTKIDSYADHWGTNTRTISATSGGTIDLSGVTLLRGGSGTSGGTDSVRVVATGGGTVDLSNLQQVDGYVTFATDAAVFSLPSLVQAGSVSYELPDSATLNLPELLSQNGGGFAVTSGTTVNAGKLQTLANASVSFSGAGVFDAPQMTDFSGSLLTLTDGTQTVTTGGLDQVDNARFLLSNGTSFNQIGDSEYVMTSSGIANTTVLSATGAGTTLDAHAVTKIDSYADHWGTNTRTISATSGGAIDLSGLTLLRGGSGTSGGTDSVRVVATGGGTVDLSNLQQVDGYVTFATDAAVFSLPSLVQAGNVSYELSDSATLNLPELLSQSGGGFAVTSGTTVSAAKLESLSSASISFSGAGVFDAPLLTNFSGSVLTLTDGTQTVTTSGLDQVDNARFLLSNGTSFNQIGDSEYVMTSSGIANTTVLSATGAGTTLNAHAVTKIDSYVDHWGTNTRTISATSGGTIDLSGVTLLRGGSGTSGGTDSVRVVAETGGLVDLSSLTTVQGYTYFVANAGGILKFGDLTMTSSTDIRADGAGSQISAASLMLDPTATVAVTDGAEIALAGSLQNAMTSAAAFGMDTGILSMGHAGSAWLEVAGQDLGDTVTSGNFGMMQLAIGSASETVTVFLTDIYDNDGLGQGDREALYLFGSGGLDGLTIQGGSQLVIGDVPVYAFVDGAMIELHSLFGPGEVVVAFNASGGNNGYLAIPEPATAALLGLGLGGLIARRRRSTRAH